MSVRMHTRSRNIYIENLELDLVVLFFNIIIFGLIYKESLSMFILLEINIFTISKNHTITDSLIED